MIFVWGVSDSLINILCSVVNTLYWQMTELSIFSSVRNNINNLSGQGKIRFRPILLVLLKYNITVEILKCTNALNVTFCVGLQFSAIQKNLHQYEILI